MLLRQPISTGAKQYDHADGEAALAKTSNRGDGIGGVSGLAKQTAYIVAAGLQTEVDMLQPVASQGSQIIERRSRMSDEAFVALGALDDEAYYARLSDAIGVDLT